MKEDFENIDGLFREELKDFTPDLPEGAWDDIASRLQGGGKKTRFTPLFWRAAATVALLIGTAALGTYLFINKPEELSINEAENTAVKTTDNKAVAEKTELNDVNELNKSKSNAESENSALNIPESLSYSSENETETENEDGAEIVLADAADADKNTLEQVTENPVIENPLQKNNNYKIPVQKEDLIENDLLISYNSGSAIKKQQENQLVSQNNQNFIWESTEESVSNKSERKEQWLIGGQAGPQYTYRTLSSSVTAPERINQTNKEESGLIAYAAGLNVEYKPARRFSIQSGVYYSKYSYEGPAAVSFQTNNIDEFAFGRPSEISTVTSNEIVVQFPNSSVEIVNKSNSSLEDNTAYLAQSADNAKQFDANELSNEAIAYKNYEYIEIPVIARFAVIDRKFNFNLIGGLSTNILIDENVKVDYQIDLPGEYGSTNLNTLNYSSTVGFGLGYDISSKIVMTIEPQFKYFLGSQTYVRNDVRPYSLGVYTGLKYLF